MSKRAVLVFGPESSGTRVMTSILMYGGCAGSSDHYQWWDEHEFTDEDELVVWRRSFPHGQERGWPEVSVMVDKLAKAEYQVQAVVMVREHHSLVRSQLVNGFSETVSEAQEAIIRAYGMIFNRLLYHSIPYLVVTYEGLAARPEAVQKWLAWELKLPAVPHVQIVDGNEKYYKE